MSLTKAEVTSLIDENANLMRLRRKTKLRTENYLKSLRDESLEILKNYPYSCSKHGILYLTISVTWLAHKRIRRCLGIVSKQCITVERLR